MSKNSINRNRTISQTDRTDSRNHFKLIVSPGRSYLFAVLFAMLLALVGSYTIRPAQATNQRQELPTQTIPKLRIALRTGGDDLRGGQDAFMTIFFVDGTETAEININNGAGWGGNSLNTFEIQLPTGKDPASIRAIKLRHDGEPHSFAQTYDNWNVDEIRVEYLRDSIARTILVVGGQPLVRFTGNTRIKIWSVVGVATDFHYGTVGAERTGTYPLLVFRLNRWDGGPNGNAPPQTRPAAEYEDIFWNGAVNLAGYYRANSESNFNVSRAGYFEINIPKDVDNDAGYLNQVVSQLVAKGFDFQQYDSNRDNVIQPNELLLLGIDVPRATCGQTRDIGAIAIPNTSLTFSARRVSWSGEYANLRTYAHELFHQIAVPYDHDMYGDGSWHANLTLMAASCVNDLEASRNDLSVYYLDPWHRLRLKWLLPEIRNIGVGPLQVRLTPPQLTGTSKALLVYDPKRYDIARRAGEFFLLEYRNPNAAGYDATAAGQGLIIWQVEQTDTGQVSVMPGIGYGNSTMALGDVRGGNRPWVMSDGVIRLKYISSSNPSDASRFDSGIDVTIQSMNTDSMQICVKTAQDSANTCQLPEPDCTEGNLTTSFTGRAWPRFPLTFSANCAGVEGVTFSWQFDDGTTSAGASVIHKMETSGPHIVTVTASKAALRVTKSINVFIAYVIYLPMVEAIRVINTPAPIARIAFASSQDGDGEIYSIAVDGTGQKKLTDNTTNEGLPSWSPDGQHIAFISDRDGNDEIYVMNADGSGQTRLTNNTTRDWRPVWSPDGKQIAYFSYLDVGSEIFVVNIDGSGPRRLTNNTAHDEWLAWAPGVRIVFRSTRDGTSELYAMDPDGSNQTRLTNDTYDDWLPAWSPDGQWIAFTTNRARGDVNYDVAVMNADGSNIKLLTNTGGGYPSWSSDGKKIAYSCTSDGFPALCLMNADGSDQRRLTNQSITPGDPDISPGRY